MTNSDTGAIEAICEAMRAIENANCSNDLVWALDKIPLKYAPEWGLKCPAVNKDLTQKMRTITGDDRLFVVAERTTDLWDHGIVRYVDGSEWGWIVDGYGDEDNNVHPKDIEDTWGAYLKLTDERFIPDPDKFRWEEDYLEEVHTQAVKVSGITGVDKACELMVKVFEDADFKVKGMRDTSPEHGRVGIVIVTNYDGEEHLVGYGRPRARFHQAP